MYMRLLKDLKYIVIHHSATPENFTVDDIRHLHVQGNGYSDIGYHFLVNKEGLHTGRPVLYAGAHTVADKWSCAYDSDFPDVSFNHEGIGLCIIGDFSKRPPCEELINEAAYAIKRLAGKYKIKLDRAYIIGHNKVSYTICPGKHTMDKIYQKLKI